MNAMIAELRLISPNQLPMRRGVEAHGAWIEHRESELGSGRSVRAR